MEETALKNLVLELYEHPSTATKAVVYKPYINIFIVMLSYCQNNYLQ